MRVLQLGWMGSCKVIFYSLRSSKNMQNLDFSFSFPLKSSFFCGY